MEATDQFKSHVAETEGEATTPPSVEDVEKVSDDKDTQCGASRKVWFGLIALLAIAVVAGVLLSKGDNKEVSVPTSDQTSNPTSVSTSDPTSNPTSNPTSDPSDMEPLAKVVLPGVDIFDLNPAALQYRALEWLAYEDSRNLTIEDDAIELLERFSLVTLYYALGGGEDYWACWNWVPGSEWLNSSYHCDWCAIECDETGLVDRIRFYDDEKRGTLPPEIGNFRNAREMIFGITGLTGSIPTEIGNLQQLTSLDLGHNRMSGSIPSEIGNMRLLTYLDIGYNTFSGTILSEIGNLQQLSYLGLGFNTFSGTIPSEIGNLQQLTELEIWGNTMSGTIPSEIGNQQQLTYLELSYNSFSGTVPSEIGNLQQLTNLGLGGNAFSGTIPSEIGKLQQLSRLALGANAFSGTIPSEIGKPQQLTDLFLSDNIGLTGTVPVEVGQLELIKWATFQNTSLTGGLDDLAFCKSNREDNSFRLEADCSGGIPEITCECCTMCYDMNGTDCDGL